METPFGTVYSTNLTPDPRNGIGTWSFSAFQRAMREGVSRDGSHLYPAFPYTAFTRTTDEDLTALYAYLMSQPPVASTPPATALGFPFGALPEALRLPACLALSLGVASVAHALIEWPARHALRQLAALLHARLPYAELR